MKRKILLATLMSINFSFGCYLGGFDFDKRGIDLVGWYGVINFIWIANFLFPWLIKNANKDII